MKVQDPNGSTEPTVVQDRMEELKVFLFLFMCHLLTLKKKKHLTLLTCLCPETYVEIQQYGS